MLVMKLVTIMTTEGRHHEDDDGDNDEDRNENGNGDGDDEDNDDDDTVGLHCTPRICRIRRKPRIRQLAEDPEASTAVSGGCVGLVAATGIHMHSCICNKRRGSWLKQPRFMWRS